MIRKTGGNGSNGTGAVAEIAAKLPNAAEQKRMVLTAIGNVKELEWEKGLIYGPEGIGKSWWANRWEKPVFISTENGLKGIKPKPKAFPEAESWEDIFEAVNVLRTQPHDYKTLVIDSADWAQALCEKMVLTGTNYKSIVEYAKGFGKGYTRCAEEWRKLLVPLGGLMSEVGMNVVITAHSKVKNFNNPEGDNYDRWQMNLPDTVYSVLKEWSDFVLFANYAVVVDTDKGSRGKGYDGRKVIHGVYSPAWDAKNRYGISQPIEANDDDMGFASFWEHVSAYRTSQKEAA